MTDSDPEQEHDIRRKGLNHGIFEDGEDYTVRDQFHSVSSSASVNAIDYWSNSTMSVGIEDSKQTRINDAANHESLPSTSNCGRDEGTFLE